MGIKYNIISNYKKTNLALVRFLYRTRHEITRKKKAIQHITNTRKYADSDSFSASPCREIQH